MKIIHIIGCQCSGKTYVLNHFRDNNKLAFFDLLEDFYIKNNIVTDEGLNWDKLKEYYSLIPEVITNFINDSFSKRKIPVIEAGINKAILDTLRELREKYKVYLIKLEVPEDDILCSRAKLRNLSQEQVLKFKNVFLTKAPNITSYTQEQAINKIEQILENLK